MKRAGTIALFVAIGTFSYGQSPPILFTVKTSEPVEYVQVQIPVESVAALDGVPVSVPDKVFTHTWANFVRVTRSGYQGILEEHRLSWLAQVPWSDPFKNIYENPNNQTVGVSEFRPGQTIPLGYRLDSTWIFVNLREQSDQYNSVNVNNDDRYVVPAQERFIAGEEVYDSQTNDYVNAYRGLVERTAYEEKYHELIVNVDKASSGIGVR